MYEYQFGFRKHHSTSHALITLVERVTKALDTGKYIVGVFLDPKKSFDTVDHIILLKKIEKYGIGGNTLKWFKSFFYHVENNLLNTMIVILRKKTYTWSSSRIHTGTPSIYIIHQ